MRKHFLLLFLMAILPFTAWAVELVQPEMVSLPKLATGLIYNGSQQTLLTGSAVFPADYDLSYEGGGIVYEVTATDVAPTTAGSKAFPKATNAGVWVVWYKVLSDGTTYAATDWKKVGTGATPTGRVRISKATPVITRPQAATGLKYTADEQGLLRGPGSAAITGDTEDELTLLYSIDNGNTWMKYTDDDFDETFVGEDANNYTIKLKVEADDVNENWIEATDEFNVTIGPKSLDDADVQITLRDGFVNPVYTKEAKTLQLTDIVVTWKKTGGDVVLANTGVAYAIDNYLVGGNASNINAGPATCNLTSGSTPNFTGGKVNFTIEKRLITDANITVTSPDVVYKGETLDADALAAGGWKVNDGLTAINADLTLDTDYTLTTSAKNVTTGKKSSVVVEGTGNYKGSKTVKFDVTKATLYVDAKPYTTGRGTAVTNDDLVNGNYYEFRGWLGDDATAETKPTVTGTPTMGLKDLQTTDNAGHFAGGIEVKTVGNLKADNYQFAVGNAAMLNVDASVLTIQFKSDLAFYYKDVVPDFATYTNFVDISTPAAVTAMTIKMYDGETELNTGDALTVGKTYTLKVTDKTITTNFALEEEIADKSITVQKLPIWIKAGDQAILYNAGASEGPQLAKNAEQVGDDYTSWTEQVLTICSDAEGTAVTKADFKTKYNVWTEDFVNTLTWNKATNYSIAEPGNIVVNLLDEFTDDNFTVNTINGNVSWTDVVASITLAQNAEMATKVAEYDNAAGITVQMGDMPLAAKRWHAIVLPFETTPAELVGKLGTYVVVNTFKSATLDADGKVKVSFGMEWDNIPAGTPFLIKPAAATNWNTNQFTDKTISATINNQGSASDKATFKGIYVSGKSIRLGYDLDGNVEDGYVYSGNAKDPANWTNATLKYRWLDPARETEGKWATPISAAHNLLPMDAYLQLCEDAAGARVFVEDFENGTTSIKSLNADEISGLKTTEGWYTIDGIKLQSAPTEKGIYINNGKKVVLK